MLRPKEKEKLFHKRARRQVSHSTYRKQEKKRKTNRELSDTFIMQGEKDCIDYIHERSTLQWAELEEEAMAVDVDSSPFERTHEDGGF